MTPTGQVFAGIIAEIALAADSATLSVES
jgi:hypothetical protein